MHCLCPYGLSENTVMIEKATTVFYINDADEDGQLNDKELQGFVQEMTNIQVDKVLNEELALLIVGHNLDNSPSRAELTGANPGSES